MFRRFSLIVLLLGVSFSFANPLPNSKQQTGSSQGQVDLTMLTVTVQNKAGSVVTGLHRENFGIIDDKEARSIEFFDSSDTPLSIGILVDNSNSLNELRRGAISQALSRLFELSNPRNEYFGIVFDTKPRLLTDWKGGPELVAEFSKLKTEGGRTAIYDALLAGIEKLQSAHYQKRVIFIITDGLENASHHKLDEVKETLKRSDILFCSFMVRSGTESTRDGFDLLSELAKITGGIAISEYRPDAQEQAIKLLAFQLRNLYRLGFRPDHHGQISRYRRVTVKVKLDSATPEFRNLTARTQEGYYTK